MMLLFSLSPILAQSLSTFARPYDSTLGVPDGVFIAAWVLILLFLARLAWEFRDKLFGMKRVVVKKQAHKKPSKKR
jgi:hypothetical protein